MCTRNGPTKAIVCSVIAGIKPFPIAHVVVDSTTTTGGTANKYLPRADLCHVLVFSHSKEKWVSFSGKKCGVWTTGLPVDEEGSLARYHLDRFHPIIIHHSRFSVQ